MKKKLHRFEVRKKNKTRKIFLVLLIVTLLGSGGVAVGYLKIKPFLRPLTQKAFARIQQRVAVQGIKATSLEFEDVRWKFPDRIRWKNMSVRVYSAPNGTFWGGRHGVLWASEVEVKLSRIFWGHIGVALRGGFFPETSDPENQFSFFADQCQLDLYIPWRRMDIIRSRLAQLFNEVCRVLKDGKTLVPIKLSGRIRAQIFGKQEEVRIWLVKEGTEYRLVMDPDDLKRIAGSYSEKVSDPEIKVLAGYPLWVLKALRITDRAREISHEAFERDPHVPEDAFRHVWWSYHLTKAFGPEFSKELTDAHEEGSTINTEEEHLMDYNNNKIGSGYALQGYPESSLLERTQKDPNVFLFAPKVYQKIKAPEVS